ncbi:MAG TPA: cytochrome c oxidase assembly protein, partial [Chthoniobacterales bacterium]
MNSAAEAAFLSWNFEPLQLGFLALAAGLYGRGWIKLNRQVPHRFPVWRLGCYLGGILTLFLALASPLDAFASLLLLAHMTQHLMLTMVAAPLLLLGAPMLPMLCGLPRIVAREVVGPFLSWPFLRKVGNLLTHPVFAWLAFVISNVVWHAPPLYELALRSPAWHKVEHLCFLGTALLFWWFVIQPWPSRPRWPRWAVVPYLLLADLQNTALSAFLSFYESVLYPTYAAAPRLGRLTALEDQAGAGALMWVPGSMIFLIPVTRIAVDFLSRKRRMSALPPRVRPPQPPRERLDLLRLPVIRGKYFRQTLQIALLVLAALVVLDGLRGPQTSAMNLAGVLPWTHWRGFTVVALLMVGNLFCMACPFTFVRDLGRRFLPARLAWPRALRSKWIAVALIVLYLWSYEIFDLWDNPAATAWIILGYFLAAFLIDGFFRKASFCKYVCPIGQFHFVQSLVSPFEIKVREPEACAACRTHDCIKGNEQQRGCELQLFQPRKSGNMDCTFCLDCVKACPKDNVGMLPVWPGGDLLHDSFRSSVGKYSRRPDLAALMLVLVFGAFANAAGMLVPVLRLAEKYPLPVTGVVLFLALTVAPLGAAIICGWLSRLLGGIRTKLSEVIGNQVPALVPLGFSMWLAHFLFHLFTAS